MRVKISAAFFLLAMASMFFGFCLGYFMAIKELDDYHSALKAAQDYFGYQSGWQVLPIADHRGRYWGISGGKEYSKVCHADSEEEMLTKEGNYCETEIFTYLHLDKYVYHGPEYTAICVDKRFDGNKFLAIFANSKERPDLVPVWDSE